MAIEIEHKYLVVNDSYRQLSSEKSEIRQGFLSRDSKHTVRVRVRDEQAVLTIKGLGDETGAARPEFEYSIPLDDAVQLLSMCEPPVITKTRHIVTHDGNRWEVDEFHGDLQGLTLAELEIPNKHYRYSLPPFVGENVTGDPRYYNSRLGITK